MSPSVIAAALSVALAAPPQTCPKVPLSAEQASGAAAIETALRDAETRATEDPEQGVALLQAALERARTEPLLVALDDGAAEARLYAMLALARGLLGAELRDHAAGVLDAALATAGGRELPARLFGPSLMALHDERRAALGTRASATLQANCTGPCVVIVDAANVGCADVGAPLQLALPPGEWNVLLVDAATPSRTAAERIQVAAGDSAAVTLTIPAAPAGRRRSKVGAGLDDGGRKLPRWAGILGVAIGAAALGAGGALVAVDGRCPDATDPMGAGACQNILNTDGGGYAMIGIGAAALVGFGIALGLGERKQARARKAKASARHGGGLSIRF